MGKARFYPAAPCGITARFRHYRAPTAHHGKDTMAQRANGRRGRGGALDNAWRTVEPAPAVLLYGAEEYFASRARQRLRGLYGSAHPDL